MSSSYSKCIPRCLESIKNQDMFEESLQMRLTDSEGSVKSYVGSVCSLLLIAVTFVYAYFKFEVLLHKKDVNILSTIKDLHYNDEFVFDSSNGMNIAVAFTAYDDEKEWILDPSYGKLVFNEVKWGERNGSVFFERVKLKEHRCTREELGLVDGDGEEAKDERKFYDFYPSSRAVVYQYWQKFICLDDED